MSGLCHLDRRFLDRRQFLQTTAALTVPTYLTRATLQNLRAENALASAKHYEVVRIDRTTVKLEYRDVPRRNMDRELPHWRYTEVCEVELKSGAVGYGETLLYYTWGLPSDDAVKRSLQQNAVNLMWDDSLGAGLQMAIFDAIGKTAGVPVHRLLGQKVHDRTPLSWWNIDTSAEDMALDCKTAHQLGYLSYKTKGRPWFDVHEQVATACAAVPAEFKIDMDFNDTLRTAEQAIPILKDLEKYPQIDIYETPIPQSDVAGNKAIRAATRVNIAMHYGRPAPGIVAREDACDGFVVGGGASKLMRAAAFTEAIDKQFWLQLVGSGLTAAYSLHFGGVLSRATWPAVNCHQLYQHDLLAGKLEVKDGTVAVPDAPGIGYEPDLDFLQKHRVERPASRPEPDRLILTSWPDGQKIYTASNGKVNFMLTAGNQGKYGFFKPGAHTLLVPDDGSPRWKELYAQARAKGPIRM